MITSNGTTAQVVSVLEMAVREAAQYWGITGDPKRHDFEMWEKAGAAVHVTGPYLKLIAMRKTKAIPSERLQNNCAKYFRMDVSQLFEAEPPHRAKLHVENLPPVVEDTELDEVVDQAQAALEEFREAGVTVAVPTLDSILADQENQALNFLAAASQTQDLKTKALLLLGGGEDR